ncbi:copper resistance CopC/CopD family protein [Niallia sp. 03133]|uniref:copper resistance CopC/CopD family protein n=1 Tax=Niallia sp. 03133 TaxID=3458060 RepID=UPI00404494CD
MNKVGIKKNKFLAAMLFILISMFLFQGNASAHAYIIKSNPSESESLDSAPTAVTIEFNEKIQTGFTNITVLDSSGKRVDKKKAVVDKKTGKIVSAALQNDLPDGVYSIEWRVLSADGHSVSGIIPFCIGELPKGTTLSNKQYTIDKSTTIVVALNKVLLYTGFCLYMGILLFYTMWFQNKQYADKLRARTQKITLFALVCLILSIVSFLIIQTETNAGISFFESLRPIYWLETLKNTKEGAIWIIQLLLLIILLSAQHIIHHKDLYRKKRFWLIPAFAFAGIMISKAFIGHPSSSPYNIIAIMMDFLHMLGASIWLGGIMAIVLLLPDGVFAKQGEKHDMYWRTVQNFSHWALFSVAAAALSGAINASLLIPDFHSLVATSYGIVLLIKIALVLLMICFGSYHLISRTLLSRVDYFKKSIKIEMSIGVLVLVLTGFFTQLQTPILLIDKAFYGEAEVVYNVNMSLSITPKKTDVQNEFEVLVFDNNHKPVNKIEQITINLKQEDQNHSFSLTKTKDGKYTAENLQLNQPGKWKAVVHLLTEDLNSYDIPFSFQVR